MKRQKILFVIKFSFSCLPSLSGVKNEKLNNGLILTGKYVVQIFKIKLARANCSKKCTFTSHSFTMKNIFFYLLFTLFLFSCNNTKKKQEINLKKSELSISKKHETYISIKNTFKKDISTWT